MCYSAESSIISFLIGGGISIYLLGSKNNTNKHIGLFFLCVSMIQFLEFMMWIDQDCGLLNNIASRSVIFVLGSQIYSIFLGAYLYKTTIIPEKILKILLIPITIIFLYFGLKNYFDTKNNWCTKPNEDKSLQWANVNQENMYFTYVYYAVFLLAPFLIKELWKGLLIFILGIISFNLTRYKNGNTSNSRWCYYSAFVPLLFVLIDYYQK